jgi:hypothetical protein
MRPKYKKRANEIKENLSSFHQENYRLPGIQHPKTKHTLTRQLIDSEKRVEYVRKLLERDLSERRADPNDSAMFDPIKGAIVKKRNGALDEAFWLVFYSVHFGEHREGGWCYAREVYNRCGEQGVWDWETTKKNLEEFRPWLAAHKTVIEEERCESGGFGKHRSYQSLSAHTRNNASTGAAFETYVNWISPPRSHSELMEQAEEQANGEPEEAFDLLYNSMDEVASFGRLAKFDYLTMIGKLDLADIRPGSAYMEGSTGPMKGVEFLLGDQADELKTETIDRLLVNLGEQLGVGMQVIEDALCNWQKNPWKYKKF